jgi:hypothetical protein
LSEFGKKPKAKKYSVVESQGGHKTMQEDANRKSAEDLMEHMKRILDALIAIEGAAPEERSKKAEEHKF